MKIDEIVFGVWIFISSILKTIIGIILLLPTFHLIREGEWFAPDPALFSLGDYISLYQSTDNIGIYLLLGLSAIAGVYLIVNGGIKSYLTLNELYKNNDSYLKKKMENYIEFIRCIINRLKRKRDINTTDSETSSSNEL